MWLYQRAAWGVLLASGAFDSAAYTIRSSLDAWYLQPFDQP